MRGFVDVLETLSEKKLFSCCCAPERLLASNCYISLFFPCLFHFFSLITPLFMWLSCCPLCWCLLVFPVISMEKETGLPPHAPMLPCCSESYFSFFSLNSARCYIDRQYKLRVFLMVIAGMLSIMLSLCSLIVFHTVFLF